MHKQEYSDYKNNFKKDIYFTKREEDIINLLKFGYSNKRIGEILYCSSGTIKQIMNLIFRKVKVKNRTELIYKLFQIGYFQFSFPDDIKIDCEDKVNSPHYES